MMFRSLLHGMKFHACIERSTETENVSRKMMHKV